MRNEIDLGGGRLVNILQHLVPAFGHGDQPGRVRNQFLHHAPLGVVGLAQDGVERGDDGHFQFANQRQQMAAGGPAVNPKLVLNADDVHVADVDEVRRALVGREILLFYFETHDAGILVALLNIINRHRKALALGVLRRHRGEQVGRERGDATLARQIVAEEGDLSNFRFRFHRYDPYPYTPQSIRIAVQYCSPGSVKLQSVASAAKAATGSGARGNLGFVMRVEGMTPEGGAVLVKARLGSAPHIQALLRQWWNCRTCQLPGICLRAGFLAAPTPLPPRGDSPGPCRLNPSPKVCWINR